MQRSASSRLALQHVAGRVGLSDADILGPTPAGLRGARMVVPEGFKFPDVQALTQAEASRVIDELHTFADAPRAAHGATVDAAVAALGAGGDTVIASMHAGAYQAAAFIREEASAQEADLDDQCFCAGVSFGLGMMLRWLDAAPPAGPSALSGRAFELGEAWSERMRERTGVCDG